MGGRLREHDPPGRILTWRGSAAPITAGTVPVRWGRIAEPSDFRRGSARPINSTDACGEASPPVQVARQRLVGALDFTRFDVEMV